MISYLWSQQVLEGSKESKKVLEGSKESKKVLEGSKWSLKVLEVSKWSQKVLEGSREFKRGTKRFFIIKNNFDMAFGRKGLV